MRNKEFASSIAVFLIASVMIQVAGAKTVTDEGEIEKILLESVCEPPKYKALVEFPQLKARAVLLKRIHSIELRNLRFASEPCRQFNLKMASCERYDFDALINYEASPWLPSVKISSCRRLVTVP